MLSTQKHRNYNWEERHMLRQSKEKKMAKQQLIES